MLISWQRWKSILLFRIPRSKVICIQLHLTFFCSFLRCSHYWCHHFCFSPFVIGKQNVNFALDLGDLFLETNNVFHHVFYLLVQLLYFFLMLTKRRIFCNEGRLRPFLSRTLMDSQSLPKRILTSRIWTYFERFLWSTTHDFYIYVFIQTRGIYYLFYFSIKWLKYSN